MESLTTTFSSTFGSPATGSSIPLSQVGMTNYGNSSTGFAGQTNSMMGRTDGMSLLSSFGSIMNSGMQMYTANLAAKMKQRRLQMKARMDELEADQIELNAEDTANSIKNQLLSDIASTDAFFAGRGIDIGSGTVTQINTESRRRAGEDINATRTQAKREARFTRVGAAYTRADARAARLEGKLDAAKALPDMLRSGSHLYSGLKERGLKGLLNG